MSSGTPALEGLFLSNMCACEQALGQFADALSSAGTAVGVAPRYVKARSRLATIYVELGMYDDAVRRVRRDAGAPPGGQRGVAVARRGLAAATRKAKQSHPVDWIKLLGVSPNASAAEMKKAYSATRAGAPPGQARTSSARARESPRRARRFHQALQARG